jgi:diguanylate cyclase (GGDEF)-like protein
MTEINEKTILRADPEELREMLKRLDIENPNYNLVLDELTRKASTDQLTGLLNRNMWPSKFLSELKYTDENSKYLGCLLLDLDDFGQANKNLGHDFGDLLLNQLGICIRNQLRNISQEQTTNRRSSKIIRPDIIGRYGGEEFIILAPQGYNNEKEALHGIREVGKKVQLIGETITTSALIHSPYVNPENYITISLGCALYQGQPEKSAEFYDPSFDRAKIGLHPLIQRADEALKKAKLTGKNRSICLEEIV